MATGREIEPRTNLQVQQEYERLNTQFKTANTVRVLAKLAKRAFCEAEIAQETPVQAAGWKTFETRILIRSAQLRKSNGLPILIGPPTENEPGADINELLFVFITEDDSPYVARTSLRDLQKELGKEMPGRRIETLIVPCDDISAFMAKYGPGQELKDQLTPKDELETALRISEGRRQRSMALMEKLKTSLSASPEFKAAADPNFFAEDRGRSYCVYQKDGRIFSVYLRKRSSGGIKLKIDRHKTGDNNTQQRFVLKIGKKASIIYIANVADESPIPSINTPFAIERFEELAGLL